MKRQDKKAEIVLGHRAPDEGWLEDPSVYTYKRTHLELLQLTPLQGQFVLDAGCGPGTYGIILAQQGNKVIGIDISPEEVAAAKERSKQKGVDFSPIVGDLENLPFKDKSFDICFCGWTLHHFPDIDTAVAELVRVLKPGGKIALAEPNESNLAMRLSRFIENLAQKWVLKAGWDTPNRTIHKHNCYLKALEQQRFTDIKVSSCFPGGLPPLPIKGQRRELTFLGSLLIHILFCLRRLLFTIAAKVLPRPLNGADLLITGIKGGEDIR